MLEIINGFLLCYLSVLCILNVLVPLFAKRIAACICRPSNAERSLWTEVLKLKNEQKSISMKDEFAAYSKLQRQINKLEIVLKDMSQSRISKNIAIKGSAHIGFQVLCGLAIFFSIIWYRHEPIVTLKGNLFPLTDFLRYPSSIPNAISTHVWVLITNVAIRFLLKPLIT